MYNKFVTSIEKLSLMAPSRQSFPLPALFLFVSRSFLPVSCERNDLSKVGSQTRLKDSLQRRVALTNCWRGNKTI